MVTLKHLYDIKEAALSINRFIKGKSFSDYKTDELLQSAIERKFEIIGEALNRINKDNQKVLEDICEYRNIISLKNLKPSNSQLACHIRIKNSLHCQSTL